MAKLEREDGGLRCHLSKPSRVLCSFSLLIFLQLYLSEPATAQIYQCGPGYFTDQPCDGSERKDTPEEEAARAARAAAKQLKEDADLFERQLRLIVTELNNGKPATARSLAQDYGIDFDRVYAQWSAPRAASRAAYAEERATRSRRQARDLDLGLGRSRSLDLDLGLSDPEMNPMYQGPPQPSSPQQLLDPFSGTVMPRSGGGYVDPRDGTFHHDVGGGVVNTRTGEFSPTH